jgi:hypothetical protein
MFESDKWREYLEGGLGGWGVDGTLRGVKEARQRDGDDVHYAVEGQGVRR